MKRDRYKSILTKEWLEEHYFEKKLTLKQCAGLVGCNFGTIHRYLKKYGLIKKRSNFESQTLNNDNTGDYQDRDWLCKKYIVEKKNTTEIAKICNAGRTTIKRWLRKYGIKARTNSEAHVGIKRSSESRQKQSKSVKGEKNHFYGKSHKKEAIESIVNKRIFYPYQGGRIKWYKHKRLCDGKYINLQGTWELETARFLDKNKGIYLVHGEFSGFVYFIGGKRKMYFPDFYLPKYDLYLEVKGFFNDEMRKKIELVTKRHKIKIEIWQERDLMELGVLPKRYKYLVSEGYYKDFLVRK
jgi:transposase